MSHNGFMRLTLVGNRRGRRVVLWGQVLKMALLLAPLPALVTGGVYRLVRKEWNTNIFLLGLGVGFAIALVMLIMTLFTPIQRLPLIGDKE